MARNILVLWRWQEALWCKGRQLSSSIGNQMQGVTKNDRLFICATTSNELYLLGLLQVRKVVKETKSSDEYGSFRAICQNLSGKFKILPLGQRKWQLRFVNTNSLRLNPNVRLALQVRTHRFLSDDSADLLTTMLGKKLASNERIRRFSERELRYVEGQRRAAKMVRSVRNPHLRLAAKNHWGMCCCCCGFNFGEFYGEAGEDFAIIHHLDPLADSKGESRETGVEDVRIVCANCHYILHSEDPPIKINELKQQIMHKWTTWSNRGVRRRIKSHK